MKRWSIIVSLTLVTVMLAPAFALAASFYQTKQTAAKAPATVQIQGKVLAVGKDWVQVQVSKILKGSGLRAKDKIRFREAKGLTVMQNGKPASIATLKAGENVEITAQAAKSGNTMVYTVMRISITQ